MCFPVNIPKVLGTASFTELWWLLLNQVLGPERDLKQEISWRDYLCFYELVSCKSTRDGNQVTTTGAFVSHKIC